MCMHLARKQASSTVPLGNCLLTQTVMQSPTLFPQNIARLKVWCVCVCCVCVCTRVMVHHLGSVPVHPVWGCSACYRSLISPSLYARSLASFSSCTAPRLSADVSSVPSCLLQFHFSNSFILHWLSFILPAPSPPPPPPAAPPSQSFKFNPFFPLHWYFALLSFVIYHLVKCVCVCVCVCLALCVFYTACIF